MEEEGPEGGDLKEDSVARDGPEGGGRDEYPFLKAGPSGGGAASPFRRYELRGEASRVRSGKERGGSSYCCRGGERSRRGDRPW